MFSRDWVEKNGRCNNQLPTVNGFAYFYWVIRLLKPLLLVCLLFFQQRLFAQYILNGSAQQNSCNCYTLTQPQEFKSGSVWNSNKINLNTSFDFWFNVFLGCNDIGADGIVFILQPISTSVGSSGEGMGFGGVSPSIGIALDTYQNPNLNDPFYDHISIQSNGIVNHANDLAGPMPISSTDNNVEDCQWHKLRITWDAGTKWLRTYFDGVLRLEKQVDLVATIFNNDPNVYWGFTGATGGMVNLQQFCTALDPIFTTNLPNNILCEGEPITFNNTSESFAPITNYNWSFGDGSTSTAPNPPPHLYAAPGVYQVSLKIKGLDGCERDSSKTITVASIPSAELNVYDTCFGKTPRLEFENTNFGVSYSWELDGTSVSGSQQPILTNLAAGNHHVNVVVASNFGCGVPSAANASFLVKPKPVVDALVTDGCVNEPVLFQGVQTDAETSISKWNWLINNSGFHTQ
ncbi:MAG TPA: PKD domain-containing protein, partial [Flavisolibacter sp.]